jgi:branched-chain amino acid transport system permease protein
LITNSDYLKRTEGLRLESMWQSWLYPLQQAALDSGTPEPPLATLVQHYRDNSPYLISSFLVLTATLITILIVRNIKYSTSGRALLAIREDVIASEAVGVPTVRYKITAFVIGAALAGLAGAILSHYSALNPNTFRFMYSVTIVLFVIVGGQGSITGTIVAAAVLTIIPVVFQRNTVVDPTVTEKWRMVLYAVLIIVSMLFMPHGVFGRYEITDLLRKWFGKRKGEPQAATRAPGKLPEAATSHTAPGTVLLQAEHVTMQFGGLKAVDDLSLHLRAGELVGLIGPNGAGKTTVFNVLTGVYKATSGRILLTGQSIHRLKPHAISRRGVARTFQNIRLFGNLSVLDNVMIAQHAHHQQGIPSAVLRLPGFYREEELSRQNAMGYLEIFGLAEQAEECANALSYGDQRRLEIARALATRPKVLLLDEPAAGMNPTEKRELMEMIRSIRTRFGLTILIIEHDMKVIMGVCERIMVLDYGKTIASGTPDEIRRNPAVIEAYLGAPGAKG